MSVFILTYSRMMFESVYASPAYALQRRQRSHNRSSTSSRRQSQRFCQEYLAYAEGAEWSCQV